MSRQNRRKRGKFYANFCGVCGGQHLPQDCPVAQEIANEEAQRGTDVPMEKRS